MIALIVATSENGVIGNKNSIPWYLPCDLKHFAQKTTGHTVLMGRKTFESILARLGKPLPNRKNIVLTTQPHYAPEGALVVHSWEEAVEKTKGEDVYVAGGAEIYKLTLPHADTLFLTVVHAEIPGDTFFTFTKNEWREVAKEFHPKDEKNEFDCTFYSYERI